MKPYRFDLERSARGLRLNRFLHALIVPAHRQRFAEAPAKAMEDAGLSNEEQRMVMGLDWPAMMDHGASFFCLEKLARTQNVSNPSLVAAFRGESLESFLKTRRVPGAR